MVEMSASSSNSDGVAFSRRRYSQLEFITINKQKKLAAVTPSAKRNTYSVAMMVGGACTQGSVLTPATLGWGNATPTALLLLVEAPL